MKFEECVPSLARGFKWYWYAAAASQWLIVEEYVQYLGWCLEVGQKRGCWFWVGCFYQTR